MMKILCVYYSFTGNTQSVVKRLALQIECDIVQIKLKNEYSGTDDEIDKLTQKQVSDKEIPEICYIGKNISDYDTVILGIPVWWLDVAPAMRSFLENNNL